jgi:hypothetical protein
MPLQACTGLEGSRRLRLPDFCKIIRRNKREETRKEIDNT